MKHWMLIIIPFLLLMSCNQKAEVHSEQAKNSNDTSIKKSYKVESNNYSKNNINIKYPKIINITNGDKINALIKEEATRIINSYSEEKDHLDINYLIMLKSNDLISIQYTGSAFTEGAAYPLNVFYTSNIDINKGSRVKLIDLIEVNEAFVEKFKEGDYKSYNEDLNLLDNGVITEVLSGSNSIDLISYFKQSDEVGQVNDSGTFSYITQDAIGVSISVPHALGDHLEMEISFSNLLDNIKKGNKALLGIMAEK
ncbi:DUF4163 domain-containing protein [Paenibacillus sp. ACRSA]|uniref:DUF4163 domain-containing protein n=1 Tax=Paenibacillus sp. ACRSA TaxID=2918211 RepID=UPI001EF4AB74|nr:DUF4163 domain-containing protein [Paenibacillus sp. ACRSA]MCG7379554.1 DUF4163 domain-containing protein [Paenibacillus sp. ACRSA]